MTKEEELCLLQTWPDPRYELVNPRDIPSIMKYGFSQKITQAYNAGIISREEYEYMFGVEPLDEESTERCHEIFVKIGVIRKLPQG